MKAFRKMGLAIVAVLMACLAFTSCDDGDGDDLGNSKDLVGTWVYCQDGTFEVLTINADGTLLSNGVEDGEPWQGVKGLWSLDKEKLVMIFEDDDNFVGTVEVVAGKTLTMINSADNSRVVYRNAESSLSANFVGTWSYISAGYAEVLQISADGSVVSAGLEGTEDYWDNVNGRIVVADNFISMVFEDNDDFVGQYELVDKETFVLIDVLTGERTTYRYCENDLADEIQGTWKNTGSSWEKNPDLNYQTFKEDGCIVHYYYLSEEEDWDVETGYTYNVVGDLLVRITPKEYVDKGTPSYSALQLVYTPDETLGDALDMVSFTFFDDEVLQVTVSWLRVKEPLDLPDNILK